MIPDSIVESVDKLIANAEQPAGTREIVAAVLTKLADELPEHFGPGRPVGLPRLAASSRRCAQGRSGVAADIPGQPFAVAGHRRRSTSVLAAAGGAMRRTRHTPGGWRDPVLWRQPVSRQRLSTGGAGARGTSEASRSASNIKRSKIQASRANLPTASNKLNSRIIKPTALLRAVSTTNATMHSPAVATTPTNADRQIRRSTFRWCRRAAAARSPLALR